MESSTKTPKSASKSQLLVFSPEVLKKLGIASQLTKLTSLTPTTTTTTPPTTDEKEIKQELSQSLSNAIKLKVNKHLEEKCDSQLKLALNSINQLNPNESNNLLLNKISPNKCVETNESVLNVRKSGRKRKKSTILNNYVTELNDEGKTSDQAENNQLINITENINDECEKTENIDTNQATIKHASEMNKEELKSLDPKVAEILKPLKRGRPKGTKARPSQTFLVTPVEEEIQEAEEVPKSEEDPRSTSRRRSGRQRKEKKLEDVVYYDTPSSDKVKNEDTPGKKRRGRPPRKQPRSDDDDDDDEDEEDIVRPGRRKKKINIIESSEDDEDTDEEVVIKKKHVKKSGLVECGVCNEKMANSLWTHHCVKHNYLCWRVGEQPIDLENRKLCESILMKIALTKKVVFTCLKCGEKRKSAVGYWSHVDICQKTEEERLAMRVMCPECKKMMQPCSLKIHMRNHLNESSKIIGSPTTTTITGTGTAEGNTVDENGRRVKRNAAKKAQGLINKFTNENDDEEYMQPFEKDIKRLYKKGSEKERRIFSQRKYTTLTHSKFKRSGSMACPINECQFVAFDFNEMKSHMETCPKLTVDDYICFACFFISQDERDIEKHVLQVHLMNQAHLDDDADAEESATLPSSFDNEEDNDEDNDEEDEDSGDASVDQDELKKRKRKRNQSPTVKVTVTVNSANSALKSGLSEPATRCCVDKIRFLANEARISASRNCTYPAAGKWSIEFCNKNYSQKNLFTHFLVRVENWRQLNVEEYEKYLPPTKQSISVKRVLASKVLPDVQGCEHDDWKQFQLFETETNDDILTIFCGGPVWELAWLPTPIDAVVDQILAVSIQRDFNETFKTSQSYASHQTIQFWNFGKLHFQLQETQAPKLEFILGHNHGNVWCMEWCPSGCYDDFTSSSSNCLQLRRMGLLALACSDGNIPIYSIPFPQNNNNNNNDDKIHKMFKPIESCRLIMQDDNETNKLGNWNYQCTKLNWSKMKGHEIIVAGYSNGMVCVWNLSEVEEASPLLRNIDQSNGTIILKPYFCFQPHTAAITALHFYYPLMDKKIRWLFTGSWDRNCFVWDLEQPSTPVFVFAKRGNVSDGAMINHWLCSFTSFDDVHFLEHTTTSIQNIRDFGYKNSSLLSANSMVLGLSANDWANAVAQVTLAGELCCTFQRQLLIGYDVDKGSRSKRFLLSYCETIDKHLSADKRKEKQELKNKQKQAAANANIPEKYDKNFFRYLVSKENDPYEDEPDTYEEVSHKYGLIFCDIPLNDYNKIPQETIKIVKTSSNMRDAPTEMYPILAQNRVKWNPNKQAYIYICSGYHSGFVRLRCVRFMHSKLLTFIK